MINFLDFCQNLPEATFETGDYIVREGSKGGNLYFLKSGSVEILKGDSLINTVLLPGSVIGEISALLSRPHLASARATAKSAFYVCETPDAFFHAHPEVALKIGRTLAGRLYSVSNQLAQKLADVRQENQAVRSEAGILSTALGSPSESGGSE